MWGLGERYADDTRGGCKGSYTPAEMPRAGGFHHYEPNSRARLLVMGLYKV